MRALRLLAAVALLAGIALAVPAALQAGSGGWFTTPEYRFTAAAAALKTDEIQVGSTDAHATDPMPDVGEVARVRIKVRSDAPLFVGIGPKGKVEEYLRGSSHDEFVSAKLSPFRPTFRNVRGSRVLPAPSTQTFWVAAASGAGPQSLEWNKTKGAWSVVVMRLDGVPDLDIRATIGLRFGFLTPAATGTLLAGTATLALALRRRRVSQT